MPLRMREIRKQKQITLMELEALTAISKSCLQRIETGNLDTMQRLDKIAEALGVATRDLFDLPEPAFTATKE